MAEQKFMSPIVMIINNLYTGRKCDWIDRLEDSMIQPYIIQRWLAMNDMIRVQVRWLDKYVFHLTPKMYLSLAWSILPKSDRPPFTRYLKKVDEKEEFDFILSRVRRHFKLADNDFNAVKDRLITAIKNDMVSWFSYYGIPKRFWKIYQLNFNLIKNFGVNKDVGQKGLANWGL